VVQEWNYLVRSDRKSRTNKRIEESSNHYQHRIVGLLGGAKTTGHESPEITLPVAGQPCRKKGSRQ